jgi:predicted transcriptional regulator
MQIHFTPEEEARLSQMAVQAGVNPEQMVKNAALSLLDEDARFRAAIRQGIAEADRDELISEEEMDERLKRMLQA